MTALFRSLQQKLLISFFGVTALTVLILGITAYQVSKYALIRSIGQSYADIAAAALDRVDRTMFERYGDVQAFAVNQVSARYLSSNNHRAELQSFANTMVTTYGAYDMMMICNTQGKVVCATTVSSSGATVQSESLLGMDVSTKEWFKACIGGQIGKGQSYYSDPILDSTLKPIFGTSLYVIPFASPIRDSSGTVVGVWLNYVSFDRIVRTIINSTIKMVREQGFASFSVSLMDHNGTTIDDEERDLIGVFNFKGKFIAVDKALAGSPKGYERETSQRTGRDRLISYATSQGTSGFKGMRWVFLAYGDASDALSLVTTIRNAFILVGVIVLLIAIGLGFMFARSITRPIKRLNASAQSAAAGNYSLDVHVQTGDEIETLSNSFAVMLLGIQQSLEQVQQEKAGVEQKVHEAVAQLREEKEYLERSIDKMLSKMEDFANGDFTARIHWQREDDISRLYEGFNLAVTIMRDIVLNIRTSAEENVIVSTNITSLTNDLYQQIGLQSEYMDEIATATEEMNTIIAENARNATITAQAAERNGSIAKEGGGVVALTAEKMHRIGEVMGASARTIESLGNASQQISEIIDVINDIADQTNLLALNAAIEAARAGDQGRGFAVVADEVRKLAERTTQATKQIGSMVKDIQHKTHSAVTDIELGNKVVQEGVQFAERASNALNGIVESSASVQQLVLEIATASTQQTAASETIARRVHEISGMAKTSSEYIQQTTNAVQSLRELSHRIDSQIAQFIMDEGQKQDNKQRKSLTIKS